MARKSRAQLKATSLLQEMHEREIYEANQIHNITVGAMLTSMSVALGGAVIIFTGHVNYGAIVTGAGSLSTGICLPLARLSSQTVEKKRSKVKRELNDLINKEKSL